MSDLQCAATFVLVPATTAVGSLPDVRPVALHAAPGAQEAAGAVAERLGLPVRTLRAATPGELVAALDELADEYRGERVAVLAPGELLAALARLVLPEGADALVVEVDADGHRWARWPDVTRATGR